MFRKEKKVSKSQHLLERIHFFKLVFFSKRHQKQYFLLKIGKLYMPPLYFVWNCFPGVWTSLTMLGSALRTGTIKWQDQKSWMMQKKSSMVSDKCVPIKTLNYVWNFHRKACHCIWMFSMNQLPAESDLRGFPHNF